MHLNSELVFKKFAKKHFTKNLKVLEIGADKLPTTYSETVSDSSIDWHTLDLKAHWDTIDIGSDQSMLSKQIISTDEYNYPINDNTFDIVFSAQVMEHVKNIWKWMDELKRITKPGGLIIIIAPASWPYHVAPEVVDCWRIFPDGMKALMEEKGLEIITNRFDSLEKDLIPDYIPTIPGEGFGKHDDLFSKQTKKLFGYYKTISKIPYVRNLKTPITVSYDSTCVVRKPK